MRKFLAATVFISFFLPTPEAMALFGRRGPIASFLFGPRRPQMMRQGGCGGGGCRPPQQGGGCGGGGCRPPQQGGCGNGGCRPPQQGFQNQFGGQPPFTDPSAPPLGSGGPLSGGQLGGQQPGNQNFGGIVDPTTGAPVPPNGGNHGAVIPPSPVQRPVASSQPTVFTRWRGDFNSTEAVKATDAHILASATTAAGTYKYTVIQQDCVSKSAQDAKVATTMVLFSSKDANGRDQSHIAFIPGTLSEADKSREVAAAWQRVKAVPNQAGGGRLRDVEGDPSSFYTTFSINGLTDYPETQVQLKKIVKNGQEQYISRYVHKHGSSLPDNRWRVNDADAPYYCENSNQAPVENSPPTPRVNNPTPANPGPRGNTPPPANPAQRQPNAEVVRAGQAVMVSKCLRCHGIPKRGSPAAPVFNPDGSLKSGSLADIRTAVENGSMPAGGTLTPAERQAILAWAR